MTAHIALGWVLAFPVVYAALAVAHWYKGR